LKDQVEARVKAVMPQVDDQTLDKVRLSARSVGTAKKASLTT